MAVTKAFLPLLRAAPGRVVFIGSISGRMSNPLLAPYCASKHALEAIAESLQTSAQDLYAEAGFVDPSPEDDVDGPARLVIEIEAAVELTAAQRRALIEIYRGFVDANAVRRARGSRAER